MVFQKFSTRVAKRLFVIEEDLPEVGWNLYVYEEQHCIYDYLLGSAEICKEFALEKFGVPIDSWKVEKE